MAQIKCGINGGISFPTVKLHGNMYSNKKGGKTKKEQSFTFFPNFLKQTTFTDLPHSTRLGKIRKALITLIYSLEYIPRVYLSCALKRVRRDIPQVDQHQLVCAYKSFRYILELEYPIQKITKI